MTPSTHVRFVTDSTFGSASINKTVPPRDPDDDEDAEDEEDNEQNEDESRRSSESRTNRRGSEVCHQILPDARSIPASKTDALWIGSARRGNLSTNL